MPITSQPEMERNTPYPCAEERRALTGDRREMGHRSADGSRAAKIKVGSVAEKLSWVLKLGRAML